jgi:membrane-bound inhibitor of C-type lysozyme
MSRPLTAALAAIAAMTLAACQPKEVEPAATPAPEAAAPAAATDPVASIPPAPTVNYACGDKKLAVKLLGATAEVAIDGGEVMSLPVLGDEGTTYTNGRHTLFIKQGVVSYATGRMAAVTCTGS